MAIGSAAFAFEFGDSLVVLFWGFVVIGGFVFCATVYRAFARKERERVAEIRKRDAEKEKREQDRVAEKVKREQDRVAEKEKREAKRETQQLQILKQLRTDAMNALLPFLEELRHLRENQDQQQSGLKRKKQPWLQRQVHTKRKRENARVEKSEPRAETAEPVVVD
jgi:colicin import membrane protein